MGQALDESKEGKAKDELFYTDLTGFCFYTQALHRSLKMLCSTPTSRSPGFDVSHKDLFGHETIKLFKSAQPTKESLLPGDMQQYLAT